MSNEIRCCVCEATFREEAMIGNKCKMCHELFPEANSRADIKNKNKPKAETMTNETVRTMIYEVLEETGMVRHKCEVCGKMYYRTSPAQKVCRACKDKDAKEKS